MTGLLLGILLSRTVSGLVGEAFGWREMYQLAAVSIAVITAIMWKALPRFTVHSTLSYPSLMLSMVQLWQRYSPCAAQHWHKAFCPLLLAPSGLRWR